jgi:hypothetical protein
MKESHGRQTEWQSKSRKLSPSSLPVLLEYLCAVGDNTVEVTLGVQFISMSAITIRQGRAVVVGGPQ